MGKLNYEESFNFFRINTEYLSLFFQLLSEIMEEYSDVIDEEYLNRFNNLMDQHSANTEYYTNKLDSK